MKISILFCVLLCMLFLLVQQHDDHNVNAAYAHNLTTVSKHIKVAHGKSYSQPIESKYFGVWTMLFTTNFFGNYYFFDQTEFAKFQKGQQAVALQENSGVGANTTLFLQLGDKGKTLLQTYPHNTTIYFVAENTNLIAQDGEIERLSMSIEFLPAGWMIFIFVVIGLVITLICLVLLVALPLMLCIGLGRVLSKIGMTNTTSDIEAPQPLYDEE